MKVQSYRTTMPFDNRSDGGSASLSTPTQKSVMPFNNVPTIQDIIERKISLRDYVPSAQGNWAEGEDVEKNYREEGDDYKRRERDLDIFKNLVDQRNKNTQQWKVRVPGGTKTFMSFELARKYTREKNLPFSYVQRVAQNNVKENDRIDVIADSINKVFMVESINYASGVRDTGSAFCIAPTYFLTCAHVIRSYNKNKNVSPNYFSDSLINIVNNNQKVEAFIVDIDPKLDMAILKCNINVEPLKIDLEIKIGMDIITIGSPHGYENNVSNGIVGSLNKKVYFYQGAPQYMFVDLSVFPGNSGGPVIRIDDGKVIGMVTLIIADSGGYGLNAALPSSYMVPFCSKNIKGFSVSN